MRNTILSFRWFIRQWNPVVFAFIFNTHTPFTCWWNLQHENRELICAAVVVAASEQPSSGGDLGSVQVSTGCFVPRPASQGPQTHNKWNDIIFHSFGGIEVWFILYLSYRARSCIPSRCPTIRLRCSAPTRPSSTPRSSVSVCVCVCVLETVTFKLFT